MDLDDLLSRHSFERPRGTPTLSAGGVAELLPLVPGWEPLPDGKTILWRHRFRDFADAMAFLNQVAVLAESEGHHPDVRLHSYRWLELELSTHSIGGLSENDFILAAKVNRLAAELG